MNSNSGRTSPSPLRDSTETDALITACLCEARSLGHVRSYKVGREKMEIVYKNIEALSPGLSTTQRSLLATAILYYLWNSVMLQKVPRRYRPDIIDINDKKELSEVIMTCFVWIVSYQDDRPNGAGLDKLYGLVNVDVSEWDTTEDILQPPPRAEPGSAINSQYVDLIRARAINWVKEIATDFNSMNSVTKISKLSMKTGSAINIGHAQRVETVTDSVIKSLLSHLNKQNELTECRKIMEAHSSWMSPPWLSALAIVVLLFLGERGRSLANYVQPEELRQLVRTCLLWIQSVDEDLGGVEVLANNVIPGSIIAWKHHDSGAFRNIWHRLHTFDLEDMKNPWPMEIEITGSTVLCHATTCKNLLQMLREAADRDGGRTLTINGRQSAVNYPGSNLVWTGVQLMAEELEAIPNECLGKQLLIKSPTWYGPVYLQFRLQSALGIGSKHAHILSTRQYSYEYSQSILITSFEKVIVREEEKRERGALPNVTVGTMYKPLPLWGHRWKLAFSKGGEDKSWTHPELVFAGDLSIPLEKITMSFIGHGHCVGGKTCDDCGVGPASAARAKFYDLLKLDENLQLAETYFISDILKPTDDRLKVLGLDISLNEPPESPSKKQRLN